MDLKKVCLGRVHPVVVYVRACVGVRGELITHFKVSDDITVTQKWELAWPISTTMMKIDIMQNHGKKGRKVGVLLPPSVARDESESLHSQPLQAKFHPGVGPAA